MYAQVKKPKENKKANHHTVTQKKDNSTQKFKDNRPETIAQRKRIEDINNSPRMQKAIQLQSLRDNYTSNNNFQHPIQKQEKNNTGLPDNLKSGMESLSGMDLSNVRVHYNSSKPKAVQAHAYAQGSNIHLASGQEKHLPHELGHVVQQAQGRVKATTTVGGVAVNDNPSLESEATVMGNKAVQMYAQVEKAKENKNRAVANSVAQLKGKENNLSNKKDVTKLSSIQLEIENEAMVSSANPIENISKNYFGPNDTVQKVSLETIQRVNIESIDGGELLAYNKKFTSWLEKNVPEIFENKSYTDITDSLFDNDRDQKLLQQWVNGFNRDNTTVQQDVPLPDSVEHDGKFVSFKTNIVSGIDGLFDIWIYHDLGVIDVDVKIKVDANNQQTLITLRDMENYWTNRFRFRHTKRNDIIRVDINIYPIFGDEEAHYKYNALQSGSDTNPSVSRVGQVITSGQTSYEADGRAPLHEMGHTLGLHEEYNLDTLESEREHHTKLMSEAELKEYNLEKNAKNTNLPKSIMGEDGMDVKKWHYRPILNKFEIMMREQGQWEIIE